MKLNIIEILVVISLMQGFLFSIVILTQKQFKVKANKYLAYGTFLLSYVGVNELLRAKDIHRNYKLIGYIVDDIPWLLLFSIPMIIYFLKSTNHKLGKSRKLALLFIPFLIFFILFFCIVLQFELKWINWDIIKVNYRLIYNIEFYFSILFNVILYTLSYFIINRSYISYGEKKWLQNIWLFSVILLLIWMLDVFIMDEIYPHNNKHITYPVWLGVSVYVYWLIFKGLIQLKLTQDKFEIHNLLKLSLPKKTDLLIDKNPKETSEPKNLHFQNFLQLMDEEKLYHNPDLSRDIVAEKLNVSIGYFSQLISASTNSNFTSIINEYRINDVKQMLLNIDFDKYSIVAIGLEAGFKSKSAFYSEFKKTTGYTPNQFKIQKNSTN
jgi:AraC-like DNA-binding protein